MIAAAGAAPGWVVELLLVAAQERAAVDPLARPGVRRRARRQEADRRRGLRAAARRAELAKRELELEGLRAEVARLEAELTRPGGPLAALPAAVLGRLQEAAARAVPASSWAVRLRRRVLVLRAVAAMAGERERVGARVAETRAAA